MPMDRKKYPKDWRVISNYIRFERAKGKCEECGAPHNGWRDGELWFEPDFAETFPHMTEDMTRIILTTAHLGIAKPDRTPGNRADTMDCREENLKALCQRCHNINRRRANRRKSLVNAGQMEMF